MQLYVASYLGMLRSTLRAVGGVGWGREGGGTVQRCSQQWDVP